MQLPCHVFVVFRGFCGARAVPSERAAVACPGGMLALPVGSPFFAFQPIEELAGELRVGTVLRKIAELERIFVMIVQLVLVLLEGGEAFV